MVTIGDNSAVINGMTEPDWLKLLCQAMERRQPVVLLLSALDESKKNELEECVERHHYWPPRTFTEDQWNEYKVKLNLSGYAAKEQGINRNEVFFVQPRGS